MGKPEKIGILMIAGYFCKVGQPAGHTQTRKPGGSQEVPASRFHALVSLQNRRYENTPDALCTNAKFIELSNNVTPSVTLQKFFLSSQDIWFHHTIF
jgi:hypothetical protein